MRQLIRSGIFGICALAASIAHADIAVIVNPANDVVLSGEQIKDLFIGRRSRFPNASAAKPVDQADGRPIRNEFYALLVGKDESDMKVYWSTMIFTGNGRPPISLGDDGEIKKFVKEDAAGIGYVESKSVDSSVKVVHTFKQGG